MKASQLFLELAYLVQVHGDHEVVDAHYDIVQPPRVETHTEYGTTFFVLCEEA